MDWRLLVGKAAFGFMVIGAWSIGLLNTDIVVAVLLGLISIDDLAEGIHLKRLSR